MEEILNINKEDFIIFEAERIVVEKEAVRLFNEAILFFNDISDDEITYYSEGVLEKIKNFTVNISQKIWEFIKKFIKGAANLITKPFGIKLKWASPKDDKPSPGNDGGSSSSSKTENKAVDNNNKATFSLLNKEYIQPETSGFIDLSNTNILNTISLFNKYKNELKKEANKVMTNANDLTDDDIDKMQKEINKTEKNLTDVTESISKFTTKNKIDSSEKYIDEAIKSINQNDDVLKTISNILNDTDDEVYEIFQKMLLDKNINIINLKSSNFKNNSFSQGLNVLVTLFNLVNQYITILEETDDIDNVTDYSTYLKNNLKAVIDQNIDKDNLTLSDILEIKKLPDKISVDNVSGKGDYSTKFLKNILKYNNGNFKPYKISSNKDKERIKSDFNIDYNIMTFKIKGNENPVEAIKKLGDRLEIANQNIAQYRKVNFNYSDALKAVTDSLDAIDKNKKDNNTNNTESKKENFQNTMNIISNDLKILKSLFNGFIKATNDMIKFLTVGEASERTAVLYAEVLAYHTYITKFILIYRNLAALESIDEKPKAKKLLKQVSSTLKSTGILL